jgi:hypothetical protein
VTHDTFDYRELESRGFRPHAKAVLERAIARGKIFPQEISMMLSGSSASDRQEVSKMITWLAHALQCVNVTITTGKEAVEFKAEPLPYTKGYFARPKANGENPDGVARSVLPTDNPDSGLENHVGIEDILDTESEADASAEPVGLLEHDEAEGADLDLHEIKDRGIGFERDAIPPRSRPLWSPHSRRRTATR